MGTWIVILSAAIIGNLIMSSREFNGWYLYLSVAVVLLSAMVYFPR